MNVIKKDMAKKNNAREQNCPDVLKGVLMVCSMKILCKYNYNISEVIPTVQH